jgi:hypothetical protein
MEWLGELWRRLVFFFRRGLPMFPGYCSKTCGTTPWANAR